MENQRKSKNEKGRKDKMKIRKFDERNLKFEHRSKRKGWPKEKALLDKGDGLATAAGARLNDEVTSQYINI